jgi:hypothetical protein
MTCHPCSNTLLKQYAAYGGASADYLGQQGRHDQEQHGTLGSATALQQARTIGALHIEVDQLHLVQERQTACNVQCNLPPPALLPVAISAAAPARAACRVSGCRPGITFGHVSLSDAAMQSSQVSNKGAVQMQNCYGTPCCDAGASQANTD